jgi:hypothetical protein
MAANDFAIFNYGNTGVEFDLPVPQSATWEQPIVGQTFGGSPISSLYRNVVWTFFGPLADVHYQYIVNNRQSNGAIKFRTKNSQGQFVICEGKTDPFPGAIRKDGAWYGVNVTFWQVKIIG